MMKFALHRWFFWATNVVVAVALIWGFVLAGSPSTERARKFDERRLSDLQLIKSEITSAVTQYANDEPRMIRSLPETLEEAAALAQYQKLSVNDPETGEAYEYSALGTSRFQLCAVFTFPRAEQYDIAWDHEAGRQCFTFDVLKDDRFPIREPVPLSMN